MPYADQEIVSLLERVNAFAASLGDWSRPPTTCIWFKGHMFLPYN